MKDIFILAVEDDPIYAETLEMTLDELGYPNYTIVDNAQDAIKAFKEKVPDVVLLDIEIKGNTNGIELADKLQTLNKIPIIFVTAFVDAEVFKEAKQTGPSAYLVKPYHTTNLQAAIELALLKNEENDESLEEARFISGGLFIKLNNKLVKANIEDINFIEVDEKYCFLNTAERRFPVCIRLKNLLQQLPDNQFVQVHRSYAIKLQAISEINLEDDEVMVSNKAIPIGKTYREALMQKLKIF